MIEITSKELAEKGIGTYIPVSDSFVFEFPKPKSLNSLHGLFANPSITIAPNFVFEISEAFVVGQVGMAVFEDYLITDTAIRKEFLPEKRRIISAEKNIASIAHIWAYGNYFHWLISVISRISLLHETGTFSKAEAFIVNSCSAIYEREGFALMGIEYAVPIFNSWIKCKNLILPSPMNTDAVTNPKGCKFLREVLTKKCQGDSFPHKIAIRRRGGRKIINEEAVYNCLSDNGFQFIYCEDYSFSDQVRMFSNAEYVVAPHGAGLANIVFCKPETKILEIVSPIYLNDCFRKLAAYSNLDYRFVLGDGEISLAEHRDTDIIVNVDLLRESLYIK